MRKFPLVVGWVGLTTVTVQHKDSFIGGGDWGRFRWIVYLGENNKVRWYCASHRVAMAIAVRLMTEFSRFNKFPQGTMSGVERPREALTPIPSEPVFP